MGALGLPWGGLGVPWESLGVLGCLGMPWGWFVGTLGSRLLAKCLKTLYLCTKSRGALACLGGALGVLWGCFGGALGGLGEPFGVLGWLGRGLGVPLVSVCRPWGHLGGHGVAQTAKVMICV